MSPGIKSCITNNPQINQDDQDSSIKGSKETEEVQEKGRELYFKKLPPIEDSIPNIQELQLSNFKTFTAEFEDFIGNQSLN